MENHNPRNEVEFVKALLGASGITEDDISRVAEENGEGHILAVGDKVRLVGVDRHPFANQFFNEGDTSTVIDATAFVGMPCVEIAATKNIQKSTGGNEYGGDYGGIPFAGEDLKILIKMEAE